MRELVKEANEQLQLHYLAKEMPFIVPPSAAQHLRNYRDLKP